ncbi:MAG TPA: hypothetical protein VGR36_07835, partial [Candidatus Acidoferrales bacterium]|nr:hypothetical protein [Candidatus Acidoferrales bacterium]
CGKDARGGEVSTMWRPRVSRRPQERSLLRLSLAQPSQHGRGAYWQRRVMPADGGVERLSQALWLDRAWLPRLQRAGGPARPFEQAEQPWSRHCSGVSLEHSL